MSLSPQSNSSADRSLTTHIGVADDVVQVITSNSNHLIRDPYNKYFLILPLLARHQLSPPHDLLSVKSPVYLDNLHVLNNASNWLRLRTLIEVPVSTSSLTACPDTKTSSSKGYILFTE